MKVYYDGEYNKYKIKDESGKEIIYDKLNDIPYYEGDITEVEIEDGTTTINPNAFYDCESLKKVIIPNSVTEIGYNAFEYCIALEEIILPNNLREINEWTFSHCESLKSITIPKNVTKIGEAAFTNCMLLEEVVFGDKMPKIYYNSFDNCRSLNSYTKEKIFYQIAKNIQKYEILDFFGEYNVEYNSELIQELISININFFNAAHKIDKEVFLDAALDSINSIEKKHDFIIIRTDLCNIIKNVLNSYDLVSNGISLIDNEFVEKYNSKIDEKIKEYFKKGEIER